MTNKMMIENELYINEWTNNNPFIKEPFLIEGTILYKDSSKQEKIDLTNIYLPDILKNKHLRERIGMLDKDTLFEIINLYAQTEEILNKELELTTPTTVISCSLKKENDKFFIVFEDSEHKKYRFNTAQPETIINIYETLKNKKGDVTLTELGSEIKNATITK